MKKIIITAALLAATGIFTSTSAQVNSFAMSIDNGETDDSFRKPHKICRPTPNKPTANVSYDASTTTLTVKFLSNSRRGTVDVYRNGAKVAGVTANSGTIFSCKLREYGMGNYNVIISNGNTVIGSKNYIVK